MTPDATSIAKSCRKPQRRSHGWQVVCPCHDDKVQSLSIGERDGKVLLRCHAGCSQEALIEHFQRAGLWPTGNGTARKTWLIKSAGGAVQASKIREDTPDGKRCHWDPSGVSPKDMLYLAEATQNGYVRTQPLYVCEGEKATDAAVHLGLQAVGTVGGASSCPLPGVLSCLDGFPVVLWPDNDVPGHKHMQEIAGVLSTTKPKSVCTVDTESLWAGQPLTGQDAADLLALPAGGLPTLEPVQPRRAITVMLDTVEPEEVEFLWHPYVPLGKLTLLEGDPGTGKSFMALKLAAAVSKGLDMPGQDCTLQGKVLYMVSEDGVADTIAPRLRDMGADTRHIGVICGTKEGDEEGAITFSDMDLIEAELAEHRPKLLIVDPLQAYLGSGVDMNHAEQTRPILFALSRLAERYGTAILVVRHWRKSQGTGKSAAIYRGLGSIDIVGAARSVIAVALDPKDDTACRRMVRHVKCNIAAHGPDLQFRLDPGYGFRWVDSFAKPPADPGPGGKVLNMPARPAQHAEELF